MRHILAVLFLLASAAPLAAQVGYPPDDSPYRDIPKGKSLTVLAGHIAGDGGIIGVGPHDGMAYGARFGLGVSGPLEFAFAVQYADLQGRLVTRDLTGKLVVGANTSTPILTFETSFQFTFTGSKTWHGLAPYVGAGLGYARRTGAVAGPDAFDFGGRIYWVPIVGTRLFVSPRTFIRAEARSASWKLAYPAAYFETTNGILDATTSDKRLSNTWFQVGVGYSF